jgi:alpha-tubulin suppressor-like RCC1 family protein/uncharacterized protein YjdB
VVINFNRDSLSTRTVGDTVRIIARVVDQYGNLAADQSVSWSSTNEAVATVSSTGLITIRGRGNATISAFRQGIVGNFAVRVTPIARVIVQPSPVAFRSLNDSIQATARVEDAQGIPFTNVQVVWAVSNPQVATVTSTGLVRSVLPGGAQLQARADGVFGTAPITVQQIPAAVIITPANPAVGLGMSTQLSAAAVDARGNPIPGLNFQWRTSDATIASITPNGFVTGLQRGVVTITATAGGFVATTSLAVTFLLSSISAGDQHACGVATLVGRTQAAVCWGLGLQGRLGTGNSVTSLTPAQAATVVDFNRVAAGGAHTCGNATDGSIYCWGYNGLGQIGNATMGESNVPVQVAGTAGFTQASAGLSHSCALNSAGQAFCWGSNQFGQIGGVATAEACGTTSCRRAPTAVTGGLTFQSISPGAKHTCGVASNAQMFCWGDNAAGQLGTGNFVTSLAPIAVASPLRWAQVAAGDDFTCARSEDGLVYCWGRNDLGQLGNGTTSNTSTPTPIVGSNPYTQVTAGGMHACARTATGALHCWGLNTSGQLGNGTATSSSAPVTVGGSVSFNFVTAGRDFTCAISTSSAGYCWGANINGQLGTGTTNMEMLPVRIQ